MVESVNVTRWGVRAVDADSVRVNINGLLFDFDPRGAADLAQTIRVILGIEPSSSETERDALKAELAAYRAAADSTDIEGDVRDHLHGLADWEGTVNGSAPGWLVDAVMGFVAPHVGAVSALKAELAEARRVITALPDPGTVEELREKITEIFGDSNEVAVEAFLSYAWSETARIAGNEMTARWQAEDELAELRVAVERLTAERVRAEHFACRPHRCGDEASGVDGKERCHGCRRVWPCPPIAALDTPTTPESPREPQEHVDTHGRSWDPHPFAQTRRTCRPVCVCGLGPDHQIHQPAPESPESEETTDG